MSQFRLLNISRQITEYSCGPAAVQAVLRYWGHDVDQQKLMELFKTTEAAGTYPENMASGIRALGLQAEFKENCTLEDIDKFTATGHPVVALGQVWRSKSHGAATAADEWGSGHYFVVLGTDKDNVYFQDPYLGMCKGFVPRRVFEDHWHQIMDGDDSGRKFTHVGVFIEGNGVAASTGPNSDDVDLGKLDFRKLGSVNLLVTQFSGSLLPFDFLDSLRGIWETEAVRPDAFIILRKDEEGRLSALEGGRVQDDGADLAEINALVAAIAARSVSGPVMVRSQAEAAIRAAASGDFGLSTTELNRIAEKLPNNHSAIIVLVENLWERKFRAEAESRGGKIITQRTVSSETIAGIANSYARSAP